MQFYSHLSDDERDQIAILRAAGRSMGAIARALGRAKAAISRELQRNPPGRAAVKLRRASGGRTSSSRVGVCRAGSAASRRSWKECRRAKPADRCR